MGNSNNAIGKRIKEIRVDKGLRQTDFESIGLNQGYLSMIETGKVMPDIIQLMAIADALDVSILNIIDVEINKDNILSFLEKLDKSPGFEILEVKQKNGKTIEGIFFKDPEINEKIHTYKLLKDIFSSNMSNSDLIVYKNKFNTMK